MEQQSLTRTDVEGKQCMKNWEICKWSESQIYIRQKK